MNTYNRYEISGTSALKPYHENKESSAAIIDFYKYQHKPERRSVKVKQQVKKSSLTYIRNRILDSNLYQVFESANSYKTQLTNDEFVVTVSGLVIMAPLAITVLFFL